MLDQGTWIEVPLGRDGSQLRVTAGLPFGDGRQSFAVDFVTVLHGHRRIEGQTIDASVHNTATLYKVAESALAFLSDEVDGLTAGTRPTDEYKFGFRLLAWGVVHYDLIESLREDLAEKTRLVTEMRFGA